MLLLGAMKILFRVAFFTSAVAGLFMCASQTPEFSILCNGDAEAGLLAIGIYTRQHGIKIDSVHAFDPDRNLVLRYVNPNNDVDVFGALYIEPGAVVEDVEHMFVVYTKKGKVKFAAIPQLKKQKIMLDSIAAEESLPDK